jgi:hypothetical protein
MDKAGYGASSHTHTHTRARARTRTRTGIRELSFREQETQAKLQNRKQRYDEKMSERRVIVR